MRLTPSFEFTIPTYRELQREVTLCRVSANTTCFGSRYVVRLVESRSRLRWVTAWSRPCSFFLCRHLLVVVVVVVLFCCCCCRCCCRRCCCRCCTTCCRCTSRHVRCGPG